jgi:hypothetical protein
LRHFNHIRILSFDLLPLLLLLQPLVRLIRNLQAEISHKGVAEVGDLGDLGDLGEVVSPGEVEEEVGLERAANQGRKTGCVSGARSQDTDSRTVVNIEGRRKPLRLNWSM